MESGVLVMKGGTIANTKVVRDLPSVTVAWCMSHSVCCVAWCVLYACMLRGICHIVYIRCRILYLRVACRTLHVACCILCSVLRRAYGMVCIV
jgi:hypothetical protein